MSNDKRVSLWTVIVGVAVLLLSIGLVQYNDSGTGAYSVGLVVALIGIPIWISGCVRYARAKGRSSALGFLLSLFWVLGLVVLLLLKDLKQPEGQGAPAS